MRLFSLREGESVLGSLFQMIFGNHNLSKEG